MRRCAWLLTVTLAGTLGATFEACSGEDTTTTTSVGGSSSSAGGMGGNAGGSAGASAGAGGEAGSAGHGGSLPAPEILAEGLDHPSRIAVDADSVYFVTRGHETDGALMKVGKDGGLPTTLATAAGADVTALRLDGTNVYWGSSDGTDGAISVVPAAGGTSTPLVGLSGVPADIVTSTNAVYWSFIGQGSGIANAPKSGGSPNLLLEGAARVTFLLLEATNLYFVDIGMGPATGKVEILDLQLMEPTAQQEQLQRPAHLVADDSYVYFPTSGDGSIRRLAKEQTQASVLATGQDAPYGIAIDEVALYWTNRATDPSDDSCVGPTGSIVMLGLDASEPTEPTTLANELTCPTDIVVDDTGIYWVDAGPDDDHAAGRVLRLPKP